MLRPYNAYLYNIINSVIWKKTLWWHSQRKHYYYSQLKINFWSSYNDCTTTDSEGAEGRTREVTLLQNIMIQLTLKEQKDQGGHSIAEYHHPANSEGAEGPGRSLYCRISSSSFHVVVCYKQHFQRYAREKWASCYLAHKLRVLDTFGGMCMYRNIP